MLLGPHNTRELIRYLNELRSQEAPELDEEAIGDLLQRMPNLSASVLNIFYYPVTNNYDQARSGQGHNEFSMCKFSKYFKIKEKQTCGSGARTKPGSAYTDLLASYPSQRTLANPVEHTDQRSTASSEGVISPTSPEDFEKREADWYKPGRVFQISAPEDHEINNKAFVLLTSKNIEGPGLRLRNLDAGPKGYSRRNHVLIQSMATESPQIKQNMTLEKPQSQQSMIPQNLHGQTKVVYMDPYEDGHYFTDKTYVELDHVYNIPFNKYKCHDLGMLDPRSRTNLKRYFVEYLIHDWDLPFELRERS